MSRHLMQCPCWGELTRNVQLYSLSWKMPLASEMAASRLTVSTLLTTQSDEGP